MSKEVKRYGMCGFESGIVEMEDGPCVAWDDYEALLAERDALAEDAERYRWLRSVGQQQLNAAMHNGGQELDRFVDAALQGAQP